jgi:outer membrane biosynthesis protein TonB
MKRFAWFAMVAVMGWVLVGGSTGFSAPPKKAPPKHGGGKPAHPGAKPESKTEPHRAGNKPNNAKEKEKEKEKEKGKPKEGAREEHKSNEQPESKAKEYLHGEHDTIENRTVNKPPAGSVNGGAPGVGTGGDAGPAGDASGGPDVSGPGMTGRPQLFFGFNEAERGRYDSAARRAGLSRDEWIRRTLNIAAGH